MHSPGPGPLMSSGADASLPFAAVMQQFVAQQPTLDLVSLGLMHKGAVSSHGFGFSIDDGFFHSMCFLSFID